MISKRGEITKEGLLVAILFVVVLAGIYLFLFGPGKALFKNFENLIPGFNATKEKAEASQIIGYVIEDAKVQYYDGQTWIEVKDNIKIGDREITYNSAIGAFTSFYNQERAIPDAKTFGEYTSFGFLLINKGIGLLGSQSNGGDVDIRLEKNNQEIGTFVLIQDNNIRFYKKNMDKYELSTFSDSSLQNEIKSYYITWRDSIFKNPMTFEGLKYCAAQTKLKDKTYIVLDLSEPTTASSC